TAEAFQKDIEDITGEKGMRTIQEAEPIGPTGCLDVLVIAPCTGNTMAKLAAGIIDTPVTMAAKSHIRNACPLVIAPSTNDGLAGAAKNLGALLNYKSVFFVPFGQDDSEAKPRSLSADFAKIPETIEAALGKVQLQPMLL
ncbi:MAG: dipicolinate synthase subunit B, partial [Oscillospiraceae bacterium]|nr:dipicolinate synthase subunit B [Oscillospiraceae bacterium]